MPRAVLDAGLLLLLPRPPRRLGGVARERDEDVVERRPPDRDVVDADAGAVEPADRLGDPPRPRLSGSARIAALALRAVVGERDERLDRVVGGGAVGERHLEPLAADAVLQLVRRALGDHLAVVDHGDAVGEAVGLVEVLGGEQHGRSRPRRAPRSSPTARAGCAGRARSSARRGRSPAGARRARQQGPGAGACRPSRSWRAGRPASESSKRSSSWSARSPASARPMW